MKLSPQGKVLLTLGTKGQRGDWNDSAHLLNEPNDVIIGPDGALYFTDPPYGLRTQTDTDPEKKLKVNGVYRIPDAINLKPGAAPQRS